MEDKYLITIKGTMEQRGDTDTVELMTRGSLAVSYTHLKVSRRPTAGCCFFYID